MTCHLHVLARRLTGVSPPRFALPRGATGGRPRTPSLSERRMSIHRIRYQVVLMASEASPSLLFSCRATVSLTDTYDVVYVQKGTKAIAYLLINQIVMSHILRKNGRPPKVRLSSRTVHPSFLFTSHRHSRLDRESHRNLCKMGSFTHISFVLAENCVNRAFSHIF